MSTRKKQNIVRRILAHKEAIKTHDEAMCSLFDQLSNIVTPGEVIPLDGAHYKLTDINDEGLATWRPARVHRYSIGKAKVEKPAS